MKELTARFDDENGDRWRITAQKASGEYWEYTVDRGFTCIYAGQIRIADGEPSLNEFLTDFANYIYQASEGLKEAGWSE